MAQALKSCSRGASPSECERHLHADALTVTREPRWAHSKASND
jgi:hypothetical protein